MPRRSYDQYCAVARALDAVGDRWTLLIVRELLGGSRRYTDLHADLPGVSTDMLASRLKGMERDGLVTRRRLAPPSAAFVYELTPRGRALLPALTALADWGAPALDEKRPTDAVRAHWFALPLVPRLARHFPEDVEVVGIALDEGEFHVVLGGGGAGGDGLQSDGPDGVLGDVDSGPRAADGGPCSADGRPGYAEGPAERPDVRLRMDTATCAEIAYDRLSLAQGIASGRIVVTWPETSGERRRRTRTATA
ncbi:helix-turn-helix domain-containing protein [Streptomyces sp. DSM 41527]|uniref:Helix-turn-helix domain-containing protein n=1 Tax=Streptomyces mooreae TaxID=3075523 RepID=A0ABU2TEH4_9ACTN|nr:helix-turn-helix domain-containing protein [Streptomyces sp. DSM 41527]MDT0459312.1 helix-turn-helix domain-containing protein [Streptomyces sp. DSM 41527]